MEEMREEAHDLENDSSEAVLHGFDEKHKMLELL
jgi:hypothetical protein